MRIIKNITLLSLLVAMLTNYAQSAQIEYKVPKGFSAEDQNLSAQILASFNGKPLPGALFWSVNKNQFTFDENLYRSNGVEELTIQKLNDILKAIPYSTCVDGCEDVILGHKITLDKINQVIYIIDASSNYIFPETNLGFVHNQFLDVRVASNHFRSVLASGQGFLGLPMQSYGYFNWFLNQSSQRDDTYRNKGISTWFLQKNFSSTYLRAGKQDNLDLTSGSVSTSISPSFDKFITLGSQNNLSKDDKSTGKIVLFSNSDGVYEFWRDGRVIRQIPAVIGRNEIDYNQLPGGFYEVEIRLVNHNGQVLSREYQQIVNVNYGKSSGWYATVGEDHVDEKALLNAGISYQTSWFLGSIAFVKKAGNQWAIEGNATRPIDLNQLTITPTLGIVSGEKGAGGYGRINFGNEKYGTLSMSRYQEPNVSDLYNRSSSTNLSYSRALGETRIAYNYSRYKHGEQHQLQDTWNWKTASFWAIITAGIQKGGYSNNNNYGLFLNTTITLNQDKGIGSFNAAYIHGRLNTGGSYAKEFEDNYGMTKAGIDFNNLGKENTAIGAYAQRNGTRGDVVVRASYDDHITNGSLRYSGMLAANSNGIALGQSSPSGAAMLIKTPEVANGNYGFKVENYPVANDGVYAVPVGSYQSIPFAKAQGVSSDLDMNIRVPANIVLAHPGQVYSVNADVNMNLLYNGFLVNDEGNPVTGIVTETGDSVYPNGLFSIASSKLLEHIHVRAKNGNYQCNLSQVKQENSYLCVKQ